MTLVIESASDVKANTEVLKPVAVTNIKVISKKYPERVSREEMQVSSPCLHADMNAAVEACVAAQEKFALMSLEMRGKIIQAIRDIGVEFTEDLALCTLCETGRGRYDDKVTKTSLAATGSPGIENLTPQVFTGDHGMTVVDMAPYGVIGAVTPVTGPTSVAINNAIILLSGGNGVVFNPHPSATLCTNRTVAIINQAICNAGGPCSLVASVKVPTIESGKILLHHPKTAANLITGGPAVVKLALSSGKRSVCAGPGNPPCLVDESADVELAARGLYKGASMDNNMLCTCEKEVFVHESIADDFIAKMQQQGAYLLSPEQTEALTKVCIVEGIADYAHGVIHKDLVGQNACVLLSKIGVSVPEECRLAICDVPESHPLVWTEQLMPVLPIVRVPTFEKGLELSVRAEHGFKHTASMFSSNPKHMTEMGKRMNTSLFIVNGPTSCGLGSGGEGFSAFSIAGSTGEGMTRPITFVRERRMTYTDSFRFI